MAGQVGTIGGTIVGVGLGLMVIVAVAVALLASVSVMLPLPLVPQQILKLVPTNKVGVPPATVQV